jgi:hypothetical protein
VILVLETRRQKADNVHLRHASVAGELARSLALAHIVGQVADQLADDVPQSMRLLLSRHVAGNTA